MHSSPSRRRAKKVIVAHLCTMAIAQIAFSLVLSWWHPDTEYRVRKDALQARIGETPDRPLFLMVGSSRVSFAFDPESLSPIADDDGRPGLCFNFRHFNSVPGSKQPIVHRVLL